MKKLLHKIPGFKKLDEFTDTELGQKVTVVLVVVAIFLLLCLWLSHHPANR